MEAIDVAFWTGIGLVGYAAADAFGAGLMLVTLASTFAIAATLGN